MRSLVLLNADRNETIGDKFRAVSFTEVAVNGEGKIRSDEGLWRLAYATAPLPPRDYRYHGDRHVSLHPAAIGQGHVDPASRHLHSGRRTW